MIRYFLVVLLLLSAAHAQAGEVTALFIGNSYTHLPGIGTEQNPALPRLVQAIARSIDPDYKLRYAVNAPGGYSMEDHDKNARTQDLVKARYDHVILQGHSLDSLELPEWWAKKGTAGESSFSQYLPRMIAKALQVTNHVTLFVTWARHPKNADIQPSHPGYTFPPQHVRAGQSWYPGSPQSMQAAINASYRRHSQSFPVRYAYVGDAWLKLQALGAVTPDELYIEDGSHASKLGGFITALVLVRDALGLDISRNTYVPGGVTAAQAATVQAALTH